MRVFFEKVRAAFGGEEKAGAAVAAADGDRDQLKSGNWATQTGIPVEAFPKGLVLSAADRKLAASLESPVVLAQAKVGRHRMELLLGAGPDTVDMSMRVPTAPNQFKEPYLIMEAESGNSTDVAVREIHFHLLGRATEEEIAGADWKSFFAQALKSLESFRARHAKEP